jgi:DNA-binding NtrC family response regulator
MHPGRRPPPDRPAVFVADDEESFRDVISGTLIQEGYAVSTYNPAEPDDSVFERHYDVAILDMVMPRTDGFHLRRRVLQRSPDAQFIIITGYPDPAMLERAMDVGVSTFLTKPFTRDHIKYAVMGALRVRTLLRDSVESSWLLSSEQGGLVGKSAAMERVRRQVLKIAGHELPALITGESGTGKEVVARCIHRCGPRRRRPFVAINCGALSPSLVESELFGHAQGSFTGATRTKHGYFEAAQGGTLLLDEVAELSPELQATLLRVLDTGEYRRVGETAARKADVRIVSATNRDIERMVREGRFRTDLYYRLKGARIHLPPLRERRDDILPLANHFLGNEQLVFAPPAANLLCGAPWPGNCRELAMVVSTIKATTSGPVVSADRVAAQLGAAEPGPEVCLNSLTYNEFRERELRTREREYFENLLRDAGGTMSRAAARAGMDRKSLYRKLEQLGIER